jgi:hypothetical protein
VSGVGIADEAQPSTRADIPTKAHIHRVDGFGSLHAASYDAARAVVPSTLRPLRLPDGRAVIAFAALHKREWTAGDGATRPGGLPWGEVMVTILVGRRPADRLHDLVRIVTGRAAMLVLHLPMTTREACDAASAGWGQPAFVADIAFEQLDDRSAVHVSDGGVRILDLSVDEGGPIVTIRGAMVAYAASEGRLVRSVMRSVARQQVRLGRHLGRLTLGPGHPVANELARLQIAPRPFLVARMHAGRVTLLPPAVVGPAEQRAGYAGTDRELGRYTVRYPHTGPIEQYPSPAEPPTALC